MAIVALAGCAQTSRVEDNVSAAALAKAKKSVAIMRIAAAAPECRHVAVLLGVRAGVGFRRHQAIQVANVRSLTEPAVAEVELDPGEYHVLGYSCAHERGVDVLADKSSDSELYRSSYASFRLDAGEIVNVGHLYINAWRSRHSAFGRPLRIEVAVTDWPLDELERFRQRRPGLYAQMKTRLMTVTRRGPGEPSGEDCARLQVLHAEGKVQALPAACRPPAGSRKVSGPVAMAPRSA